MPDQNCGLREERSLIELNHRTVTAGREAACSRTENFGVTFDFLLQISDGEESFLGILWTSISNKLTDVSLDTNVIFSCKEVGFFGESDIHLERLGMEQPEPGAFLLPHYYRNAAGTHMIRQLETQDAAAHIWRTTHTPTHTQALYEDGV